MRTRFLLGAPLRRPSCSAFRFTLSLFSARLVPEQGLAGDLDHQTWLRSRSYARASAEALLATVAVQFFSTDEQGDPVEVLHYFDLNPAVGSVLPNFRLALPAFTFPNIAEHAQGFSKLSVVAGSFRDTLDDREKRPRVVVKDVQARFFYDPVSGPLGGVMPMLPEARATPVPW